jgi:hypothetical protein
MPWLLEILNYRSGCKEDYCKEFIEAVEHNSGYNIETLALLSSDGIFCQPTNIGFYYSFPELRVFSNADRNIRKLFKDSQTYLDLFVEVSRMKSYMIETHCKSLSKLLENHLQATIRYDIHEIFTIESEKEFLFCDVEAMIQTGSIFSTKENHYRMICEYIG